MTKQELLDAILAIDPEYDVDSLDNNDERREALAALQEANPTEPPADPEQPAADPEPTEPAGRYTVAKGQSITSKRGILGEHQAITAKDVNGGQETIGSLVERKVVDDNGEAE